MHAALALQAAVIAALRGDATLVAMIGGPRIYDQAPPRTDPPYVAIGSLETRAWDTFTARGHEHFLTLHAYSAQGGRREAYRLITRMDEILDDAALTLADHHLINLRSIFWTVVPARRGHLYQGILRLRAATQPVN
jgi:hypothetical protein